MGDLGASGSWRGQDTPSPRRSEPQPSPARQLQELGSDPPPDLGGRKYAWWRPDVCGHLLQGPQDTPLGGAPPPPQPQTPPAWAQILSLSNCMGGGQATSVSL